MVPIETRNFLAARVADYSPLLAIGIRGQSVKHISEGIDDCGVEDVFDYVVSVCWAGILK